MIVLHRPGAAEISEADAYISRLVRQASAGRKAAPGHFTWSDRTEYGRLLSTQTPSSR
jgi:hypothetical protein